MKISIKDFFIFCAILHLKSMLLLSVKKIARSNHQRCSMKKVFLGISQNPQENTYVRAFFNKVVGLNTSGGCFWEAKIYLRYLEYQYLWKP